jgi:SepF-like predicted cell division protein (DUF552 family)
MKFSLFHKKMQQQPAETSAPPTEENPNPPAANAVSEEPKNESATPVATAENISQEPVVSEPVQAAKPEPDEPTSKTYHKAMPLKALGDVENVKSEVKNGNIIILRVTPLASKSIDDVKSAVNELTAFAESIEGDIARLGEERVVICPKNIRIWREKSPAPAEALPTASPTAA